MLPLVITVEQVDGGTRRYAFADSPVSIGRSPFAELQLSEPFISRWEGTLRFNADEITYFSLGPTNVTYVNGQPLPQCEDDIPLRVDSVLTLGDLKLRFSREPVPESDLRRKGKRRPTLENAATRLETQYLEACTMLRPVVPREASVKTRAVVTAKRATVIAPQSCIVLGDEPVAQPCMTMAPQRPDTAIELDVAPEPAAFARGPGAATAVNDNGAEASRFAALRDTYHAARAALLVDIRAQLEALPPAERADFLTWLPRREPTLASDPELQLEFQRAGVQPPGDIAQLRDWLRAISPDIVPEGLPFDSQLALTRVLGLLEVLVQSLAEIHDAQESVRRRWLGRTPRRTILQSEDGNLVLAYLLNPRADWSERLRELEQSVRDVVTHELALFRATLDGARTLVNTLSPNSIASSAADERDGPGADGAPGFWTRILCKDVGDIGLWRRFLSTYGELTDGARYERIFLGRVFSRSYLAAMGRSDPVRG